MTEILVDSSVTGSVPKHEQGEIIPAIDTRLARGTIGIGRGIKPFERHATLVGVDGAPLEADVYASFSSPGESGTILLARRITDDASGFLCRIGNGGVVEDFKDLNNLGYAGVHFGDSGRSGSAVDVWVSRDPRDMFGIQVRTKKPSRGEEPVAMRTEANALLIENPKSYYQLANEATTRRTRIKKWVGATLTAFVLMPGGGIDHALDPFVDTGSVLESISNELKSPPMTMTSTLDGIPIGEYPHPKKMLAERNRGVDAYNEGVDAAKSALEQTMSDLDSHNYQAIRNRAAAYAAENPGNVMLPRQVAEIQTAIGQSNNREEALKALQPFLEFSGNTLSVDDVNGEVNLPVLKKTLRALVGELGRYPKTLLEQAKLEKFRITRHDPGNGLVAGSYDEFEKTIRFNVDRMYNPRGLGWLSNIPGFDYLALTGGDEGSVIAHEFGHALLYGGGAVSTHGQLIDGALGFASTIANVPTSVTLYSLTDSKEAIAEQSSGALSDRKDGIAHPDNARAWLSSANKAMLTALFQIAKNDPWVIDWTISSNDRLMGRGPLTVGR